MRVATIICLSLYLSSQPALAQQPTGAETGEYVALPAHNVLVTVASQPNSPLKIEDASFLYRVDRPGMLLRFKVRNISSKPITIFVIDSWNSEAVGGTLTLWDTSVNSRSMLMPGETLEPKKEGTAYKLVPLTSHLRDKLKLEGEMKVFYVLVVTEVDFSDGSVFRDKQTSAALSALLGQLQ